MDACSDPSVREVVVMAGAQLGKTEAILNIIGFHMDHDPCPVLVLQPTLEMAQAFSKDRLASGLIRATPSIRGKVKDPRARDANNTTLHKVFPGGAITIVGANSPAGLASRPIRLVLCDEVDRYPTSAGSEGDPIQLARKRAATFWNRKIVMVSTPTNRNDSRIESAYLASDQRQFYVPCRHCGQQQVLKWSNVVWTDSNPETAGYGCEGCGAIWTDPDRAHAIARGHWKAIADFKGIAGFAINGLYSPWTPLADGVRDFLSVRKNPQQLRVWTNTYLGETWEDQGETVDSFSLAERREPFNEKVPEEVVMLTAGADVQDNRIELQIIGWGRDDESWVIDHRIMYGDPSTPQIWTTLASALFSTFETHDGRELPIRGTAVDSGGHHTQAVYTFCKKHAAHRVFAIKGVGGEIGSRPVVGRPTKNNAAKCPLFPIGVDTAKDMLFSRFRVNEEGPGFIHFSEHLDDEFFKQLTAEKVVTRYHKGYSKRTFIKTRTRNEALDCMVYALAAYHILNVNVNAIAAKIEERKQNMTEEPEAQTETGPVRRRARSGRPSGFVNSWR
jgi:phage terminase large subunit GpA-like protein